MEIVADALELVGDERPLDGDVADDDRLVRPADEGRRVEVHAEVLHLEDVRVEPLRRADHDAVELHEAGEDAHVGVRHVDARPEDLRSEPLGRRLHDRAEGVLDDEEKDGEEDDEPGQGARPPTPALLRFVAFVAHGFSAPPRGRRAWSGL